VIYARLETRRDGYCRWRAWDTRERRERYVYVHQLLAIADGERPSLVFSNGAFHVHHRNRIRFDNRPENIELRESDDHGRHHARDIEEGRGRRDGDPRWLPIRGRGHER